MGGPPAVLIVVRHGSRLDAADKQWHLTSPTPYDPPLTYGGWQQSRALGARIASLLQNREEPSTTANGGGKEGSEDGKRKRKHRVIIHTSPFLRCVQTSIAMASGMAQNPAHNHIRRPISSQPLNSSSSQQSPRSRPAIRSDSPSLDPIPEPSHSRIPNTYPVAIRKATLRVDAFLGEWLSTDYFEQITPPPSSVMMVAGAKADLLRREDYAHLNHVRETTPTSGFPGGWGSPVMLPSNEFDDGPLPTGHAPNPALRRDRTSSMSSVGSTTSRISGKTIIKMSSPHTGESGVYVPPIPHYAVSASDPIPPGYVAHSKDACVNVDYQWDSMREPQNWGNGGEYGEEWSSMHKRFRNGLTQLVNWYRTNDDSTKRTSWASASHGATAADDDEDTDLVVILVTHGAGCNALIGAVTNQPVLMDVGMASLTMAVHKPPPFPTPASTPGATPVHSRASSRTASLSDEYDVKLIASTEHLRRSSTASTSGSRTPSMGALPYRPTIRYTANGATTGPFVEPMSIGEPARGLPPSGNFGSIRRAASVASGGGLGARPYTSSLKGSMGLWAPRRQDEDAVEEGGEGDDMVLNFGGEERASGPASPVVKAQERMKVDVKPVEREEEEADGLAPLSGGLWGTGRTAGEVGARPEREAGPKRRWTVVEGGMT